MEHKTEPHTEHVAENRKNTKRAIGLLLILALLATFALTASIARYVSTASLDDTARVAVFDVGVNNNVTFDLFSASRLRDSDGTNTETDVWSNNSDKVIAPGTSGKSDFGFRNNGNTEVTVNAIVRFTATNPNNIPLEYSADGVTWNSDISAVTANVNDIQGEETATLYWRWPFSTGTAGDEADTALGVAGTATVTVTATVTFTQAD